MIKILVVEDDKSVNQTVCAFLNQNGYEAIGVLSANDAYDKTEDTDFNLIISDVMMPEIDGFESGIDDYMVKPILLPELKMRIEAILRRSKINSDKKITVGSLILDAEEHSAYVDGEEIILTVREFDLIYKLLSYPKKIFTRSQLMSEFWDSESESSPRVVDVYMTKIRDKFSACKEFEIQTVHGLGYKAVIL